MTERTPVRPADALDLALAVVVSSNAPLLLLDGDLKVIAASTSFCRSFGINPAKARGLAFFDLGAGEWNASGLLSVLKATARGSAAIDVYEMDLVRRNHPGLRLVINVQRLAYGDGQEVRLLVSVSDVTDARRSEKVRNDLLHDKAVLMQEMQHRVANSLQIIASVLLQNARNVRSDETRLHLQDAHHRVMSVAALQRQLAISSQTDVVLHTYLTELCQSLGASMIRDHNQISLEVGVDDSVIGADVSVSLGLIVTELVINALKHAFPNRRHGRVTVSYRADGPNWRLSVWDDGVGMSSDAEVAKSGLGTSIVTALAKQLRAEVEVVDGHPGTAVSIIHAESANSRALPRLRAV